MAAQPDSDPVIRPCSHISSSTNGPSPEKGKRKTPEPELDWLPQGWTVEDRVRSSGATAGSVDRYYFDPISGSKFRSKKEVLYFLETGTRRKKIKTESPGADKTPKEKSAVKKQKPSEKKGSAADFNFLKVPEKVQWAFSADSGSGESWNAFIGGERVSESSKLDWLAAFTLLASKDRDKHH